MMMSSMLVVAADIDLAPVSIGTWHPAITAFPDGLDKDRDAPNVWYSAS
jgi:hypothetical protein